MNNEIKKLINFVNEALDRLYKNEKYLFDNNSSEQNKVFHFSRYFLDILNETRSYQGYNIDCEYNRDFFNERKYKEIIYENKKHRILPDFVLHKRGSNNENKLVIEFKNGKNMTQIDKYKLEALTVNKDGYGYVLGMFIKFGKQRNNVKISIFKNGREESEH